MLCVWIGIIHTPYQGRWRMDDCETGKWWCLSAGDSTLTNGLCRQINKLKARLRPASMLTSEEPGTVPPCVYPHLSLPSHTPCTHITCPRPARSQGRDTAAIIYRNMVWNRSRGGPCSASKSGFWKIYSCPCVRASSIVTEYMCAVNIRISSDFGAGLRALNSAFHTVVCVTLS